jgi:hypothetical protein
MLPMGLYWDLIDYTLSILYMLCVQRMLFTLAIQPSFSRLIVQPFNLWPLIRDRGILLLPHDHAGLFIFSKTILDNAGCFALHCIRPWLFFDITWLQLRILLPRSPPSCARVQDKR